jgi:hypothetical protein
MRIAAVFVIATALIMPAAAAIDATENPGERPATDAAGSPQTSAVGTPASSAAVPESAVGDLYRAFGLLGTFAADCGRPATPDNPYVSVTAPSAGLVLENNDVGPGYATNRYSVLAARRLSADRLEVTVLFRPGAEGEERQTLVFEARNGTRRTIFNRVEGGAIRVRHGIVLAHGIKTPLLKKCG